MRAILVAATIAIAMCCSGAALAQSAGTSAGSGEKSTYTIVPTTRNLVAVAIESNKNYKLVFSGKVKLENTVIAGPYTGTEKLSIFSEKRTVSYYCVSAKLVGFGGGVVTSSIYFLREGGKLVARTRTAAVGRVVPGCERAVFAPFPELAQLRNRVRKASGLTD